MNAIHQDVACVLVMLTNMATSLTAQGLSIRPVSTPHGIKTLWQVNFWLG
jgi:hypothetical protein